MKRTNSENIPLLKKGKEKDFTIELRENDTVTSDAEKMNLAVDEFFQLPSEIISHILFFILNDIAKATPKEQLQDLKKLLLVHSLLRDIILENPLLITKTLLFNQFIDKLYTDLQEDAKKFKNAFTLSALPFPLSSRVQPENDKNLHYKLLLCFLTAIIGLMGGACIFLSKAHIETNNNNNNNNTITMFPPNANNTLETPEAYREKLLISGSLLLGIGLPLICLLACLLMRSEAKNRISIEDTHLSNEDIQELKKFLEKHKTLLAEVDFMSLANGVGNSKVYTMLQFVNCTLLNCKSDIKSLQDYLRECNNNLTSGTEKFLPEEMPKEMNLQKATRISTALRRLNLVYQTKHPKLTLFRPADFPAGNGEASKEGKEIVAEKKAGLN